MNFRQTFAIKLIILFILFIKILYPQYTSDKIVDVKLEAITKSIKAGSEVNLELIINIKEGWHINSSKPLDPNLVPTVITLEDTSAYKLKDINYPYPLLKILPFSENELSLYEDEAAVKIRIFIDKNYKKKNITINGKIQYQPCNDQTCLFPFTKHFSAYLKIADK